MVCIKTKSTRNTSCPKQKGWVREAERRDRVRDWVKDGERKRDRDRDRDRKTDRQTDRERYRERVKLVCYIKRERERVWEWVRVSEIGFGVLCKKRKGEWIGCTI